ncbi:MULTISPECIES: nicotinate-nucleotide adenylyltransferase [Glycomyces]|uniref:Probable nicotinate-nucleotide adenylyltransferase n=1 Tax=Glycomyces artemisiae TaxID=1076443 RepID=A0A2T0UJ50_9ACTN|nr:nicotinate-nucleotide adenylyltransferase [Glycomyces artemisiae]PRY57971.1 nicotinate-nucleotide adenylyltransferase [Glycomyces artemisiae]
MNELAVRRIGVFGGTFDPPHLGHLVAASEAAFECGLDEVVFVPAGDPWQKAHIKVTDAAARLEMTRLAVDSDPMFRVSTCDIDREGATYAVDTVADVRAEYEGDVDLFFIIGADSLENLHTWHRVEDLVRSVKFIALNRPGHSRREVDTSFGIQVEFIDMPAVDLSSTECRQRVRDGQPVRYLVPDAVAAFIEERGLYRG